MVLITRMVVLANRNGHPLHVSTEEEPWTARPIFDVVCTHLPQTFVCLSGDKEDRRQTNGYDCGLWVLCMMGAIMRGYATTSVSEHQMGRVRKLLTDHILGLPYN